MTNIEFASEEVIQTVESHQRRTPRALAIFATLLALAVLDGCIGDDSSDAQTAEETSNLALPSQARCPRCAASRFSVGGTISGLAGPVLILRNNGGDDLVVSTNGPFMFSSLLASGSTYSVTVFMQPTTRPQTCRVTNGSGQIVDANVTNVAIECSTATYQIGGTVGGLVGTGLVLRDNGSEDLPISADGSFAFPAGISSGGTYSVTIAANPQTPSQTCTVANGSGTVATSAITSVMVSCATNRYAIGGSASGLNGGGLVLQNNHGDDLVVSVNGAFTFATPLLDQSAYDVTVSASPSTQTCTVSTGAGTVAGANVTTVIVTCADKPPVTDFYVNATGGSDANDGSAGAPWRTITKAIATAPITGASIFVAPGTYTTGEKFPIAPRANQHLIGDIANRGEGSTPTRISGSGPFNCSGGELANANISVAVGLEAAAQGSSIRGFSITGGSETVWICNVTTTFASNTVFGSTDISVLVGFNANVTLTGNTIKNGAYNLLVHDAGTHISARDNLFESPTRRSVVLGYSAPFTGANIDLGTAASPGNNTFAGSTAGAGLFFQSSTATVVTAVGNTWRMSVQGADDAGHYAPQTITTNVAEVDGNNFATSFTAGGGLLF